MWKKFDEIVFKILDILVLRVLSVIVVVGMFGIVGTGFYFSGMWVYDKFLPTPSNEVGVTIHPYYWSCTRAIWETHEGGNLKTGYYTYHTCSCAQWEAHLESQSTYPEDATCHGLQVEELKGVR